MTAADGGLTLAYLVSVRSSAERKSEARCCDGGSELRAREGARAGADEGGYAAEGARALPLVAQSGLAPGP